MVILSFMTILTGVKLTLPQLRLTGFVFKQVCPLFQMSCKFAQPRIASHIYLLLTMHAKKLFFCLYHAGQQCFPQLCKRAKVMPGWNDSVRLLRSKALFWNRLWSDNGCPSSGVLSQIRRKAKSRYKYAVRSLKRRKDHIVSKKISSALTGRTQSYFLARNKKIQAFQDS